MKRFLDPLSKPWEVGLRTRLHSRTSIRSHRGIAIVVVVTRPGNSECFSKDLLAFRLNVTGWYLKIDSAVLTMWPREVVSRRSGCM